MDSGYSGGFWKRCVVELENRGRSGTRARDRGPVSQVYHHLVSFFISSLLCGISTTRKHWPHWTQGDLQRISPKAFTVISMHDHSHVFVNLNILISSDSQHQPDRPHDKLTLHDGEQCCVFRMVSSRKSISCTILGALAITDFEVLVTGAQQVWTEFWRIAVQLVLAMKCPCLQKLPLVTSQRACRVHVRWTLHHHNCSYVRSQSLDETSEEIKRNWRMRSWWRSLPKRVHNREVNEIH